MYTRKQMLLHVPLVLRNFLWIWCFLFLKVVYHLPNSSLTSFSGLCSGLVELISNSGCCCFNIWFLFWGWIALLSTTAKSYSQQLKKILWFCNALPTSCETEGMYETNSANTQLVWYFIYAQTLSAAQVIKKSPWNSSPLFQYCTRLVHFSFKRVLGEMSTNALNLLSEC